MIKYDKIFSSENAICSACIIARVCIYPTLLPAASLVGVELVYTYCWGSTYRSISFGVTYMRSQWLTGVMGSSHPRIVPR